MEYMNYVIFALIILFFMQRFLPTKGVRELSTKDLKKELNDKNKQYIDVRTPGEFKARHIPGFKNIPLQQLTQKVI